MLKVKLKTQCFGDSISPHLQVRKEENTHSIGPDKQNYSKFLRIVFSVGPYCVGASLFVYQRTGANPVVLITLETQDGRQSLKSELLQMWYTIMRILQNWSEESVSNSSFDVDINNFDCNSKCVTVVIVSIHANYKFVRSALFWYITRCRVVIVYHTTLRTILEECRSRQHCGRSLKSI